MVSLIPVERWRHNNPPADISVVGSCTYGALKAKLRGKSVDARAADDIRFWVKSNDKLSEVANNQMKKMASGTVYYELCGGENAEVWRFSSGGCEAIVTKLVEAMKRRRRLEDHKLMHKRSFTIEDGTTPDWVIIEKYQGEMKVGFYNPGQKFTRAFLPEEITAEGEVSQLDCEDLEGRPHTAELRKRKDGAGQSVSTWEVNVRGIPGKWRFRTLTLTHGEGLGKVTIRGVLDDQIHPE